MALLRGANRPLLTRLIQEEVALEWKKGFRPQVEIDLASEKVIQCGGDLALLEQDDVVRSIGCGKTEKLSSFYSDDVAESAGSDSEENIPQNSGDENSDEEENIDD